MPDGLPDDLLDDLLDEMSTPGPLGNSPYAPTRVLQPISQGLSEAAERLTSKARIALRDADTERATRFIERALDLPFDDHEEVQPALVAAHLGLYSSVADCLEGADEDDERWLDAAIAVHRWIAHSMPGDMRDEMLQVISAVRPAYRLSPSETQRIEALVGDRTPTERAYDDPPTERGEQFAYVENLLRTQIRFEDEYAALSSE